MGSGSHSVHHANYGQLSRDGEWYLLLEWRERDTASLTHHLEIPHPALSRGSSLLQLLLEPLSHSTRPAKLLRLSLGLCQLLLTQQRLGSTRRHTTIGTPSEVSVPRHWWRISAGSAAVVVQEASLAGRHTGASGLACSGPPTLQGAGETAVWAGHVAACSAAATWQRWGKGASAREGAEKCACVREERERIVSNDFEIARSNLSLSLNTGRETEMTLCWSVGFTFLYWSYKLYKQE